MEANNNIHQGGRYRTGIYTGIKMPTFYTGLNTGQFRALLAGIKINK